jgi:hypothetical protein
MELINLIATQKIIQAGQKVIFGNIPVIGITTNQIRYAGTDIEEIFVKWNDGDECYVSSEFLRTL